jgi:hypothetical protein
MPNSKRLFAVAAMLTVAIAVPVLAADQPPGTPEDILGPPAQSQEEPVSKSDQHRIVGKVLQIDREQGLVKLATEEGNLLVRPSLAIVRAIKVGDTISVPRPAGGPVSASPGE